MRKLCEMCKLLSWARPHLRTRLSRTAPLEASRSGGFDRLAQERVIPNECPNKNQTFVQPPPPSAQRSNCYMEEGSRARRRGYVAQNRLKPGADSGHITVDARLVAYDCISIESEEFILRVSSSKNVD